MESKTYIKRSFLGIFIATIMNLDLLLAPVNRNLMVKDVFICCIFNESTIFKEKSLVLTFLYAAVIVLFILLYGNFFNDHLGGTGIYIFLRNKSRFFWYGRYTVELFFYSMVYTFAYIFSILIMSLYHTGEKADASLLTMGFNAWFVLTIIIYTMALTGNIISIKYGNIIGELIVIFILALLIQLCLYQQNYVLFQKYEVLRYINPINGMKLSALSSVKGKLRVAVIYFTEIGIVWSIGYLLLKAADILDKK